jgi:cytochrome oxidase Cu insertion factor (SCO1/SenC/PrrC family)
MTPAVRHRLVAAIAAAIFLLVACGGPETSPEAQPRSKAPRTGNDKSSDARSKDLAPEFSVQTFDGDTFRLSDHRGTPVVLNFWESW